MDLQEPKTCEYRVEASPVTAAELQQRYGRAVLAVCLIKLSNRHDAEDVMQDVFLKAIKKIHQVKDWARVGPWVLQIARTACIDHLRRRRPVEQLPDDITGPDSPDSELSEHMRWAVNQLPPDYGEAVTLYYLDGNQSSRVAELLGITPAAARQRLGRARTMLNDLLREEDK